MKVMLGILLSSRSGRLFKVTGLVLNKGEVKAYEITEIKTQKTTEISRKDMEGYLKTEQFTP